MSRGEGLWGEFGLPRVGSLHLALVRRGVGAVAIRDGPACLLLMLLDLPLNESELPEQILHQGIAGGWGYGRRDRRDTMRWTIQGRAGLVHTPPTLTLETHSNRRALNRHHFNTWNHLSVPITMVSFISELPQVINDL